MTNNTLTKDAFEKHCGKMRKCRNPHNGSICRLQMLSICEKEKTLQTVLEGVCIVGKGENPELFFLFKTHVSEGVCIVGKRENPELFFPFQNPCFSGSLHCGKRTES